MASNGPTTGTGDGDGAGIGHGITSRSDITSADCQDGIARNDMEIGQCGGIEEQQWRRMVTEFGEHRAGEWKLTWDR